MPSESVEEPDELNPRFPYKLRRLELGKVTKSQSFKQVEFLLLLNRQHGKRLRKNEEQIEEWSNSNNSRGPFLTK